MPLAVGETIADYHVLGILGQGGMGAVYRVRNVLSGREEAMKMVLPGAANDHEAADRFLREIRVQAGLQHPNIAGLRTAVRSGDHILMIMELIDGESVAAKLLRGPLPFDLAFRVVDDILSALAYAHQHGVIHRDIKPANIMVTARGISKLMDFGIARSDTEDRITKTNLALGSLHYMSPEQVTAKPADARSDLYSLGTTFYEMLTGRTPVNGPNEYAIMHAHLTEAPVAPAELMPGLPRGVSDLVLKSLAKLPEERFQTTAEYQAALRDALFGGATVTARITRVSTIPVDELARVESHLAAVAGPIARSLISKAVSRHTTVQSLSQELAAQIADPTARANFLKACGVGSGQRAATTSTIKSKQESVKTTPITEASLEAARKALADYLGPMARLVVQRTAKNVQSVEELREALAAEIPDERSQRSFIERLRT